MTVSGLALANGLAETASPRRQPDRLTHSFHPWAAKYTAEVASRLLRRYSEPGDLILDPFCGSGTTLVEAAVAGRPSIGFDVNPVAALITKVKTTPLSSSEVDSIPGLLKKARSRVTDHYASLGGRGLLLESSTDSELQNLVLPSFENLEHWFDPNMIVELAILKRLISEEAKSPAVRDFLLVAFSAVVVPASRQQSETRYAAVEKGQRPLTACTLFERKAMQMVLGIRQFSSTVRRSITEVRCLDAREPWPIAERSVNLILTSPPYPNTYDYYLYHKMRMVWLGLDWESAKRNEIGSRNRHSSQKEDISGYVKDMARCFEQCSHAIAPSGKLVFVIGDSVVNGVSYDGAELIAEAAGGFSFRTVDSTSYSLDSTSKMFNKSFRKAGKSEHVVVLEHVS